MATTAKRKLRGRKKGGRNKGYWYKAGRGWYLSDNSPLRDADTGEHLKERATPAEVLERARAAWLIDNEKAEAKQTNKDLATVAEVAQAFLDYSQANDAPTTYALRADRLFDFCTGWRYTKRKLPKAERGRKLHEGYGERTTASLIPLDLESWCAVHKGWGKGSRRVAIQAIKRAFNWAEKMGMISANPFKGFAAPTSRPRLTYFTKEQEQALLSNCKKSLAIALQVCIRTGMRYGSEFAKITAKHCTINDKGIVVRFSDHKTAKETGQDRLVYINKDTAPEVYDLFIERIKWHPSGPLFRSSTGLPWTQANLKERFDDLKAKLRRKGIKLDGQACLYTCRHTYAKRCLSGYWTGKPTTIEHLAKLMGNTADVCRRHYSTWCEAYTDPLWDAC